MRRCLAWIAILSRRRWLCVGAILLLIASPFVWAGYHAYAAERALHRYHSAEARTHFDACLRVWPWSHSGRLHLLAARAARRLGDYDEARRLLHQCQEILHDDSHEAVLEWAMLRAVMGDLDATAEPLRQAARQNPILVPLVLEALAEGYLTMSRIVEALHSTDDWLALEPNNAQAWFLRGKIHRQVGAAQQVAADCRRVLDLDPERAEGRWWLALALLDLGEYRKAYQHLLILQRQRADDAETRVRMAMCLWRLEREQDACNLLDRVLAEHPQHGLALRTRGQIDLTAGRFAEAEPRLSEAAAILPYDYGSQNALWECLRQEGKTEEAERQRERKEILFERRQRQSEILAHLMSQRPDDPALHCEMGTLALHLGAPRVGEAWLLNALRLDENYLPALEALAEYYRQRGDAERAEHYRQRAKQVKP